MAGCKRTHNTASPMMSCHPPETIDLSHFQEMRLQIEYDFGRGNGSVTSGITDVFIRYNFDDPLSIKAGSLQELFCLEGATSNRFLTFIERNMAVNTLVDNPNVYKTGIGASYAVPRRQTGRLLPDRAGWQLVQRRHIDHPNGRV